MMDTSFLMLNAYYTKILSLINGNIAGLISVALSLLTIMMTIDLVLSIILHLEEDIIMILVKKLLPYGFHYYIIKNFIAMKGYILDGFLWIGQKIVNGGTTLDFKSLMSDALTSVVAMFSGVNTAVAGNITDIKFLVFTQEQILGNIFLYLTGYIFCFCIFITFTILLVDMMLAMVEFQLVSVMALMLLPFGVYSKTKFIADKSFSAIINAGIKIGIILCIFNVGNQYLMTTALDITNTSQLMGYFLTVVFTLMLSKRASGIAGSFLNGGGGTSGHVGEAIRGATQGMRQAYSAYTTATTGGASKGVEKGAEAIQKASAMGEAGKSDTNLNQAFSTNNSNESSASNSTSGVYSNTSNIDNNVNNENTSSSNDYNNSTQMNNDNRDSNNSGTNKDE